MENVQERYINDVMRTMVNIISRQQLTILDNTMRLAARNIEMQVRCTELSTGTDDNEDKLESFAFTKNFEGASMKSIEQYVRATRTMLNTIDKNYKDVTTNDIKYYLALYQSRRKVSQNTLSNIKRFLSAFFSWAEDEGLITKNPVRAIKNIKQIQKEKQFLTEDEIERMREECRTSRERAIFEFLLSTGCRVSEFVALNRSDVNMVTGEVRIYATKTRKYRTGYLTARAMLLLKKYLKERRDDNEALFVESKGKHRRLGNSSVQKEVQRIGSRAAVAKHVTVHLFRKTLATTLAKHGVDIVIIKELLGHADISVTVKNYASIDQENIRMAHQKSVA